MGICPSRCGEKQPSAAVAPAALPATAAVETKLAPSPYDPNRSLKRFLHLNQDSQASATSTPRTSLLESMTIPHSSELFSLPGSELEFRSSFGLSPTETPKRRAQPNDVTLTASHFTRKPPRKGRNNSNGNGNSNSNNCNKRIRPANRGEHFDLAAHKRLVDAIARLERLNDTGMAPGLGVRASGSSELKNPAMRSGHVRHYQLPQHNKSTMTAPVTAPFSHSTTWEPVALEKTPPATDFLHETFVSLIEFPRKIEDLNPTVPEIGTKSCRFENIDGEEMLTFEFGPSGVRERLKQSPVRKKGVSLQMILQSGTQASSGRRFAGTKSSCSTWQSIEELLEPRGSRNFAAEVRNSEDPSWMFSREDVIPTSKAKSPSLALRMKALKGLRRGRLSQSLDSIESSTIHVDLEVFRKEGANTSVSSRLNTFASPSKHSTGAAVPLSSLDANRTELETLPGSSELELRGCEQEVDSHESCCARVSNARLIAAEIPPPLGVVPLEQVEARDPSLEKTAECSPGENPVGRVDMVTASKVNVRCEESLRMGSSSRSEPPLTRSKIKMLPTSPASQWIALVEMLRSLLKVLFVFYVFFFNAERVVGEYKVATARESEEEKPEQDLSMGLS